MGGGYFDGCFADFARQVAVDCAIEMVNRGALTKVRVDHYLKFFELLEYPIYGRRAHVGSPFLY